MWCTVDAQKRQREFPFWHRYHVVCLTTGQCQRILDTVQSSASTFSFHYRLVSLWSFTSCLCLLPRLLFLSTFPSVMCIRRKFHRKMRLLQLAILCFTLCRTLFPSFTQRNTFFSIPVLMFTRHLHHKGVSYQLINKLRSCRTPWGAFCHDLLAVGEI